MGTKANIKKNKLEGQKEEALKNLKKEFGCRGVKSGKRLLVKVTKEVERDESALSKQIKTLEKKVGGK